MGRQEKPLKDGPLRDFARQLRDLRRAAGNPGYRELAREARCSPSTVAAACAGEALPSQEVTLALVRACGADQAQWREVWREARTRMDAAENSAGASAPAPRSWYVRHRVWLASGLALIVIAAVVVIATVGRGTTRHPGSLTAPTSGSASSPAALTTAPLAYDRSAGAGCPDTGDTEYYKGEPVPTHRWTEGTGANWSSAVCTDTLVYSLPTTRPTDDNWINYYTWTFKHVPATARCTFSIYIADSPFSQYRAQYFWTTGDTRERDSNVFTIDQGTEHGHWFERGPLTFPTGVALLMLTDSLTEGAPAPMTASVVRLTCA